MAVHENWVQNRQATAVCDFCNRRNIPLQKCQTCNINICKKCTAQGTLQNDPRHMLAREAAENFNWHRWGKEKTERSFPSKKKKNNASHISSPEAENYAGTLPPQGFGRPSENPAPVSSNFQYFPVPYSYPMPTIYNQQYNLPVGFSQDLRQHPPIPQHAYSPPPHGMYGFAAGQPSYNQFFPQQPAYGLPPTQAPQVSPEVSSLAVNPMPTGHGRPLQNGRYLISQPENNNDKSQETGRRSVAGSPRDHQASQSTEALPRPPVLADRSLDAIHTQDDLNPEKGSEQRKQIRHGEQMSRQHWSTVTLYDSPKEPSIAPKKPQTSCQALDASIKAKQPSKRSREVAEGSGEDSCRDLSSLDCRHVKKPRPEVTPRRTESDRHSRPNSMARTSKRRSLTPENHDKPDPRRPVAKKLRPGKGPETRVVKVQVRSSTGVQRLREILRTPHTDDPRPSAAQNILPSPPSSSQGHATFSSQALKRTRLDELLDAAGVQPIPWPVESVPQVDEAERSHQYPADSSEASMKDGMVVLPTRHSHVSGQTDDDEAREAAMILLSMRRGY